MTSLGKAPSSRPRLVFWELTTGCNLRCIHCRASATELMSPDDLSTRECLDIVDQLASYAPFILVLSGGEPLWRRDVFEIAKHAVSRGIRVALATNGTLVDEAMADRIKDAGIVRVSISLDGADRITHDSFRGHDGAFEAAIRGLHYLQELGISTQINTTVSKHNAHQLPEVVELAKRLKVDAFHLFLLVPVGCGLTIAEDQSLNAAEAERILNWFYDRSIDSGMELKATCAPQYYRIARQRRAEDRKAGLPVSEQMPHPQHAAQLKGHPGGHPTDLNQMTRGCLAASGVCFISHRGSVQPCGYLPLEAGNLRRQSFQEVWENSPLFNDLRDLNNLEGKCGYCEFKQVCMGCRARAFGVTGDFHDEEPFCVYEPNPSRRPALQP
ncbi:MAG: radical SAM protein [Candidatus Solibacter usitatus]|nr:radical SAM protein [Candidatus Solibacter usitatus]